jgi:hypothetical protein
VVEKLKRLATNEGALYFLSSLIYSFSTYLIALLIPYKLHLETMADFSAAFNIIMLLSFVFEFGIVTSFLRHNQIYQISKYINAFLHLVVFILMVILANSTLGGMLDKAFGIGSIDIKQEYIYLSALSILMWVFFKNNLLAAKNIRFIIINSFIILFIRVGFLLYIFLSKESIDLNHIYLYLFITPFLFMLALSLKENISYMIEATRRIYHDRRYITIMIKRFKQFILFSGMTYIITILYVYAGRYPIVYVTEHNMTVLMAELGYAFSFFGLVLVFITSIRSYLISKFNISDMDAIMIYVEKIRSVRVKFLLGALVASAMVAYMVYWIKPSYLSDRSVVFVFILILSYMLIAYFSLITLLSKTFNFNNLELKLNILRLLLVFLSVYLIFGRYPIVGFIMINISMVGVEFIFAQKVLQKVMKKGEDDAH